MNLLQSNAKHKHSLVLYFQVHQPKRLNKLRFFDIGAGGDIFDEDLNREITLRVSRECYLPANALLLKVLRRHPNIKVAFSLSGVLMEQLEAYAPEVLESFKALANTGSVEFLSETYYHSLACMMPGKEFEEQVLKHAEKIVEHFGVRPSVFRNTELIYNDEIGHRVSKLGFTGIMADGVERILGDRSANHVFEHPALDHLKILLRNYRLSDDIAFRFQQAGKKLTAEQYIAWLCQLPKQDEAITLAMDYETFGEHHKKESGIFTFLEEFLSAMAVARSFKMVLPSVAIETRKPNSSLSVPHHISWADQERDLSAWLGNEMQRDAFDSVLGLEIDVKNLCDEPVLNQWRNLLTSDHFYYMATKKGSDGIVHNYFSPYASPYEAFINYMNILTDFTMRLQVLKGGRVDKSALQVEMEPWSQSMGNRMTMLSTAY